MDCLSLEKLVIANNPVSKVVVTNNWIVQVGQWPWSFNLAHQNDAKVEIIRSDHHDITLDQQVGGVQFLSIAVVSETRTNIPNFTFRMNSLDFENLEERIRTRIDNKDNIEIFKSVTERFVEVFREQVEQNPTVALTEEPEACIGCMVTPAEVKLVRRCLGGGGDGQEREGSEEGEGGRPSGGEEENCVNCACRPMWCSSCMGKWFASRQDQKKPETWLSSKCPCPTCRSKFCIMDVCPINTQL